ncbi:hypothetical protein [Saccharopolyspora halophila]|uniref:hypothetical protein n=1 Tax=Saccharopolyspora halophila TaxID=405551 RepID=UPI0031DA6F03
MADEFGDDVAHQRAHRRDDFAGGADAVRCAVGGGLGRGDQVRGVLAALAVGVAGIAQPAGGVGLDQVFHLGVDGFELGRDVLPRLRVSLDLVRIAGQRVQGVRDRPDVLDQPSDTGGEDRAERVQRRAQRVQSGPDRAQDACGPITGLDRLLRVGDRLRDLDTAERLRRVLALSHQRIRHYNPQNKPAEIR